MWYSGDTDFDVTEIPEKWKDESAVILCERSNYEFRKQVFSARANNDYYFRKRIKLLDKSAVDDYSEFTFKELEKFHASRDGIYLGVKIIKPDGAEKMIDTKGAVKVQKYTDSNEKTPLNEGYNKLAIPDLEIGDIIDYYFVFINTAYTKQSPMGFANRLEFDPAFIILTDKYPILKGKLGFLTERKCYINISVSNGAPQPVKSSKGDRDYYVIEYEDIDKYKTELWTFPYRQYPTVKLQVIIATNQVSSEEKQFLGTPEIPKYSVTDEEYKRILMLLSFYPNYSTPIEAAGSKFLRKTRISKNPAKLAEDLFYFYRHYLYFDYTSFYGQIYMNRFYNDNFDFVQAFSMLLRKYEIDHCVFLGVPRNLGVIDSVVMLEEIVPFIKIENNNKPIYIFDPRGHSVFGECDFSLEGIKTIGTKVSANLYGPRVFRDSVPPPICTDNYQFDSINVHFDKQHLDKLWINQYVSTRGFLKGLFSSMVLTPKDYFDEEYDYFKKIYRFKEKELPGMKSELGRAESQYELDSTDRREGLKQWLMENHIVNDVTIEDFELINQGRLSENPDLVFSVAIQTSDLVKNAGEYLILEVGKIIGRNIDLSPKEKERENDIYMASPRKYDWVVSIDIPDGYTIENVDMLNFSIQNSTGGFSSNATIEDGKVKLRATKFYLNNYEPLEKWPEMLEFLEASNEFVQQKIIFKKVN